MSSYGMSASMPSTGYCLRNGKWAVTSYSV